MKILLFALFSVLFLGACQTSQLVNDDQRSPQSIDKNQIRRSVLLSKIAKNRIVFIAEDSFYREKPTEDAGKQCLRIEDPIWTKIIDEVLNAVEKSDDMLNHIHAIRIVPSGGASAKVLNEDGYSVLEISYMKKSTYAKMENQLDVPCTSEPVKYIGKQKTIKSFQWPNETDIANALKENATRNDNIEWFSSSDFLEYLAKQQILFVVNNEKFQTRTQKNVKIIVETLEQLNRELGPKVSFKGFEKLNLEISKKSEQGTSFRILTLKSDMMSHGGLFVDATSTISRRINQTQTSGMTLFYLALNNHHDFKLSGISDLNECLNEFLSEKEDIDLFAKKYDQSGEAFLYPGFKCP